MNDFRLELYGGPSDRVEILVADTIGKRADGSGIGAAELTSKIAKIPHSKEIVVRITSRGGSLHEAVAIYDALKRHPGKVTTIGVSMVASAAVVLFCAGDKRILASGCQLMFHSAYLQMSGTAQELRTKADALERSQEMVVELFAKTTGLTTQRIRTLMSVETWVDAQESVKLGFAHKVMPSDSPQMQFEGYCEGGQPRSMADLVVLPEEKRMTRTVFEIACQSAEKDELLAKR